MTTRLYADQKQLPLEQGTVRLKHEKIHARLKDTAAMLVSPSRDSGQE
jgi:hypothetical protein